MKLPCHYLGFQIWRHARDFSSLSYWTSFSLGQPNLDGAKQLILGNDGGHMALQPTRLCVATMAMAKAKKPFLDTVAASPSSSLA